MNQHPRSKQIELKVDALLILGLVSATIKKRINLYAPKEEENGFSEDNLRLRYLTNCQEKDFKEARLCINPAVTIAIAVAETRLTSCGEENCGILVIIGIKIRA